ncbi:hypothetical protein NEMIN01_1961 [Nematocida minor]|uniref:uncharacterized protein n=1 Tax=Nematocida minor TaxID=1912983 RepID=UPI00221E81CC|nr:uncharacterized protein NEMIN01_1961 [Nematocida minor]KAI5192347.1 hypothetical protein NEMIN01_1961 [Nematocida minor]
MPEVIIIIEGIKEEIARYLFKSLKYLFQQRNQLVASLEMEGLSISLLNPNYNGISPNELKCRECFIKISKAKRIILLNEIEHRREEYFTAEYSTETKYVLVVQEPGDETGYAAQYAGNEDAMTANSAHSMVSTENEPVSSTQSIQIGGHVYRHCKNYKEKLLVLLCMIKKAIINCNKLRIVNKLFLLTRFTSLCVINSGYSLFFTADAQALEVLRALLQSIKSKYVLFLFSGMCAVNILQAHGITQIIKTKNKIINTAIKGRTQSTPVHITEIESTDPQSILAAVESMEKVLLVADVHTIRAVVKYVKKEDADVKISHTTLIKLSVRGTEVTERKYDVK